MSYDGVIIIDAAMWGWIDAMEWIDSDGPHQDQIAAYELCIEGERRFGIERFTTARKARQIQNKETP